MPCRDATPPNTDWCCVTNGSPVAGSIGTASDAFLGSAESAAGGLADCDEGQTQAARQSRQAADIPVDSLVETSRVPTAALAVRPLWF